MFPPGCTSKLASVLWLRIEPGKAKGPTNSRKNSHQVKPGPLFAPPMERDGRFSIRFFGKPILHFFQVAIVCYVCSFFMGNHIFLKLFSTKRGERMLTSYKLFWGKVSNETWGLPSIGFGWFWSDLIWSN